MLLELAYTSLKTHAIHVLSLGSLGVAASDLSVPESGTIDGLADHEYQHSDGRV